MQEVTWFQSVVNTRKYGVGGRGDLNGGLGSQHVSALSPPPYHHQNKGRKKNYMSVCTMCIPGVKKGNESLGTGVADGCKPPCGQ